jgi:hypothetical protein
MWPAILSNSTIVCELGTSEISLLKKNGVYGERKITLCLVEKKLGVFNKKMDYA